MVHPGGSIIVTRGYIQRMKKRGCRNQGGSAKLSKDHLNIFIGIRVSGPFSPDAPRP
jgi:hypothetical protein